MLIIIIYLIFNRGLVNRWINLLLNNRFQTAIISLPLINKFNRQLSLIVDYFNRGFEQPGPDQQLYLLLPK